MPQHKSAIKRVRQNIENRTRNAQARSIMRTAIKQVRGASNGEEARAALTRAVSIIDRTAKQGIIHRNTAARYKSRLTRFVDKIEA